MNKTSKKIILILIAIMAVCLMLTACDTDVKIIISATKTELVAGDVIPLAVLVSDGSDYTLSVDNTDVAKIDGDTLTIIKSVDVDTDITVTATLVDKPKVKQSKTFVVKAQVNPVTITASKYTFDSENPLSVLIGVPDGETYTVAIMPAGKAVYSREAGQLIALGDVDSNTEITLRVTLNSNSSVFAERKFTIIPLPKKPTLNINFTDRLIKTGDSVYVSQTPANAQIDLTLDGEGKERLTVDGQRITLTGELPAYDQRISVTATLRDDPSITVTKILTIKAKVQEGQVAGKNFVFTSQHLAKLFTNNLTITGTATDVYRREGTSSVQTDYDISVLMNEGKWLGTWNIAGSNNQSVEYFYKGTGANDVVEIVENKVTNTYNVIYKTYIDKNNQVVNTLLRNYESVPALWQNTHYWNPFEEYIAINNVVYDNQLDLFQLVASSTTATSEEENKFLWFSAYLAHAFTPLLGNADTLTDIYLKVDLIDDVPTITGLKAATPINAISSTEVEYTTIDLTFSDIDSTVIADVQPFGEPEHKELLEAALEKMRNADNFYFKAIETPTYTPTSDPDDYTTAVSAALNAARNATIKNENLTLAGGGFEGLEGWVTENSIMLKRGVKIQGESGDEYAMTYSGYRAMGGNSHEAFAYVGGTTAKFVANRVIQGSLTKELPGFDVSVNAFRYVNERTVSNKTVYVFTLNESTNTRDVAMQMSMNSYATAATFDAERRLEVYVDADGNLVSVVFPYEIDRGDRGYVTTTYSNVGTTNEIVSLQESGDGQNYIARTVPTTWASAVISDYRPDHSTQSNPQITTANVVLKNILGQNANIDALPQIGDFAQMFDDNMSTVSFRYTEKTGGGFRDYLEFRIRLDQSLLDENNVLSTAEYEKILGELKTMLASKGFTYDVNNSRYERDPDTDKVDVMSTGNRYASFLSDSDQNCQIVISNLRKGWLYVEFRVLGDWQLSK